MIFDKAGIMEYMLYGFPFEEHTFVKTVGFFPPATCLIFDLSSGNTVKEPYFSLNFDCPANSGSRKEIVSEMNRVFMEGLSNRMNWVDKNKTIVSLSGGLDSRGTLAGLKKLGVHSVAVTAQDREEQASRRVADSMGTEVYGIPQGLKNRELSFEKVVFLKDGLDCHPNLQQLYLNLEEMRNRFGGDITYFTGIYGGEITRHSHITGGLASLKALVHYL